MRERVETDLTRGKILKNGTPGKPSGVQLARTHGQQAGSGMGHGIDQGQKSGWSFGRDFVRQTIRAGREGLYARDDIPGRIERRIGRAGWPGPGAAHSQGRQAAGRRVGVGRRTRRQREGGTIA